MGFSFQRQFIKIMFLVAVHNYLNFSSVKITEQVSFNPSRLKQIISSIYESIKTLERTKTWKTQIGEKSTTHKNPLAIKIKYLQDLDNEDST